MSGPVRAALAGYGWWGRHIARRLVGHAGLMLTGVCAPELEGEEVDGLRVYADFGAAIADPQVEAVILTSPNQLHERQTIAAAEAGRHVFCEKPLSLSGASARRMAEVVEACGLVLGIGHERRFEPAMLRVAQMVREGDLGTIMHAEAAFSHDKLAATPKDNWRTKSDTAPAGGMTGMGIHLTDAFIGMFGEVEIVQALTADRVLGWETGDLVTVQLGFRDVVWGMTSTLSAILKTPHFIRCHVFGSDAWAEVRNDTHPDTPGGFAHLAVSRTEGAWNCRSGAGCCRVLDRPDSNPFPWEDAVVANLAVFANAVRAARADARAGSRRTVAWARYVDGAIAAPYPIAVSGREMVHNIEVLEAIAEAARTRDTVRL